MARRNFYEILNETPLNLQAEYERIYTLFHEDIDPYYSVEDIIDNTFDFMPEYLVGRTISIDDFNNTHRINLPRRISENDPESADKLLDLCEYIWNFCVAIREHAMAKIDKEEFESVVNIQEMILASMNDIGHMLLKRDNLYIFVPKDQAAIAVAEIAKKELSASILEYHHHSLKGNLPKKKAILKLMADDIENDRKKLSSINKTLENQLYQLMNKFVRHDQSQTPYIATMKPQEIEECYDDIYQMWLLTKLEIDHYTDRKDRVSALLSNINGN